MIKGNTYSVFPLSLSFFFQLVLRSMQIKLGECCLKTLDMKGWIYHFYTSQQIFWLVVDSKHWYWIKKPLIFPWRETDYRPLLSLPTKNMYNKIHKSLRIWYLWSNLYKRLSEVVDIYNEVIPKIQCNFHFLNINWYLDYHG